MSDILKQMQSTRKDTRNIYILDLDDPEYPDRYRVSFAVNNIGKKSNDMVQRKKHYNVIETISVPLSVPLSDCKQVVRKLTEKVPEKGRMKYNLTFTKDKLSEIVAALHKLGKATVDAESVGLASRSADSNTSVGCRRLVPK